MDSPQLNLLDEALIRIRDPGGHLQKLTLPELFVALASDTVRDFPALRPHQRHPWHALLVQLAALALHEAGETMPWMNADDWRKALLALTPEHSDACAWSLIAPHDKPAFLQAPVPGGRLDEWSDISTPDALDLLVTSKNHDLKGERMRCVMADDWLFALMSLQTQDGYPGRGNFGVSRMNSGSGSRTGLGIAPAGGVGQRWARDVRALLRARDSTAEIHGLPSHGGLAFVWLEPWSGKANEILSFSRLDPFYIDICRRIRLVEEPNARVIARRSTSEARRIDAEVRKGVTGDAWLPVEDDKCLTLQGSGFSYSLMSELAWGMRFHKTVAQTIQPEDGDSGISLVAQCIARGQSKTEGYHERRIPLSKKVVGFLRSGQTDRLTVIAEARVKAIAIMRGSVLRTALFYLLEAGTEKIDFDRRTAKQQIEPFVRAFEHAEDARFFDDMNREIEAEDANVERLNWLARLASRAEVVLRSAFVIGPQCGERRYRARSRALSYFHGALRSDKNFPALAQHLRSHPAAEEAVS